MDCVTRQPVAAVELGDPLTQDLLGLPQSLLLVAAFGETLKELPDQSRDRGATFGGDDPGVAIGGVVY